MELKTAAIIVAGGSGTRVGGELPKQFMPLAGKPLIFHSLATFECCSSVQSLYVVLPEERLQYFSELLQSYPISKLKKIVVGGSTRQDSTQAGFKSLSKDYELVAVHDAARPLISLSSLEQCIRVAQSQGAALVAAKASDTIKEVNAQGEVLRTLNRNFIFQAQTPQIFRYSILKGALQWAEEHQFQGTDEASLVEKMGQSVKIVETDQDNMKITTATDFLLAEVLLKQRGQTCA